MTLIECKDVSKKFGSTMALDHLDLSLDSGRIVGLVGPNGSGKTTFMKCVERLLQPTDGEIVIDGKKPGAETKAIISYLPDCDFLPNWMTIKEILNFYQDMFLDFNIDSAHSLLNHLGVDNSQRYKTLSKGTKEKVRLILAMSRNAKIYILDEPLSGVDPAAREYIIHTILNNYNEEGLVLLSTHLIEDVEPVFDEVIFLKEGRVVLHENADELREKTGKSIDAYFREVFKC